jgi:hypothetical protein
MSNRLSHSQIRLFQECGKRYEYNYIQKLREKVRSGALCFGESIDKTFEAIIKNPEVDANGFFDNSFTSQEINKKKIYLPDSLLLVYSNSDMDKDLLTEEDRRFLSAKSSELGLDGNFDSSYEICVSAKKQSKYKPFKDNERRFFNIANWHSLRRKGHVMIKTFKDVVGTQVKIELANSTGDSILGYADYVGKYGDNPNTLVLDFKTSSIEYEDDSATISPQLALYAHALGLKQAGFIVFSKRITKNRVKICGKCGFDGTGNRMATCNNEIAGKRCGQAWIETIDPQAEVKCIISEIPEQTTAIVLENAEIVNTLINQGLFIRNLGSCKGVFGLCPYYNLCFKGSDKGLEKVE